MSNRITMLGIETSCDETAAAVLSFDGRFFKVLGSAVASQVPIHKLTGGVVPEVAAREHVTTIMPTIQLALRQAGIPNLSSLILNKRDGQRLKVKDQGLINGIAVTAGPGLLPALMVGVDTANALSLATGIPVVPVQHITGHIYANFVSELKSQKSKVKIANKNSKIDINKIDFPLLALVVSGGHTEFVLMKKHLDFKKIGATVDDAAGEAFDKTAKILGLPYPGGPEISKWAEKGNPQAFDFPRPMIHDSSMNFSFAGLKTAVLYRVQGLEAELKNQKSKIKITNKNPKLSNQLIADLAASIQEAIVDTLVQKTERALESAGWRNKPKSFTLGGGVAANKLLRQRMSEMLAQKFPTVTYYDPKIEFATDNAAMIAAVGATKLWKEKSASRRTRFAKAEPQLEIKN